MIKSGDHEMISAVIQIMPKRSHQECKELGEMMCKCSLKAKKPKEARAYNLK